MFEMTWHQAVPSLVLLSRDSLMTSLMMVRVLSNHVGFRPFFWPNMVVAMHFAHQHQLMRMCGSKETKMAAG
jgi:hypothetical protein